jgi:NAD dependent epimerase/dehydratase family enzyme
VPAWITAPALRLLLGEMGRAMLLEGAYVLPARATQLGFRWRFPDLDSALADLL